MKHLIRAGILLTAIIAIVILIRFVPVSEELKPYGFYRGTDNAQEWAGQPLQYADAIRCNDCHQDKHSLWTKSKHSTVSCENCHGPGETHVEKGTKLVVDASIETCAVCHAKLPARPSDFPQVDVKTHAGELSCVTCHNPHSPQFGK